MKSLKSLGAIAIGAVALSTAYALAVKDRSVNVKFDEESGRSIRHIVSGDHGEFLLKDDERTLKAEWRGDFTLNDPGTDIKTLDHSFEIELREGGVEERVKFSRKGGDIQKRYYRDGDEQPAGPETDEAAADLLTTFLRASGFEAEERVAAILKGGDATAVLAEMDLLEGDHALRRYAVALTEQADLSAAEIAALAAKLETVESDHDLRLALAAILENETISAELTPALLSAAQGVESDHDLRKLVEAFAEGPMNEEAVDLALGLYERIDSDHDLRKAAEALLENDALDLSQTARLLSAAAAQIDSDHDMRLILSDAAPLFSQDAAITDAWFKGFYAMESSHDQRVSLIEAADVGDHPESAWTKLIDAVGDIESSHDQRVALIAIADQIELQPDLIAAYRNAADKIDSDYDRKRALEAVGDDVGD